MKTIGITLGDIAGIGPEVVRKALRSQKLDRRYQYEIILEKEAPKVLVGRNSEKAAKFAWRSLEIGVKGCLNGKYAALVTAPINKAGLKEGGFRYPGQTEWLAESTSTKKFSMMLIGGTLKVSLVTTHVPLRKVSSLLSKSKIVDVLDLTYTWLKKIGVQSPKIFVSALNPHGGVEKEMGKEEKSIIVPAVKEAQRKFGKGVQGPYSSDSLFRIAYQGGCDAIVCMYHDQGLIPLKMVAFNSGVNLTLGLPLIRTSPDHGTAYDIAGKNKADPGSMIEAIRWAVRLASLP